MRVLSLLQFGVVAFVGVKGSQASPGFLRAAVKAHKASGLLAAARKGASSLLPRDSEAVRSLPTDAKQNLASKAAAAYRRVAYVAAGSPQAQQVQKGVVQRALGREMVPTSSKVVIGPAAERLSGALKSSVSRIQMYGYKNTMLNDSPTGSPSNGFGILKAVRAMGLSGKT